MAIITEDDIEQEAVQILKELGYRHLNCFTAERDQISDGSGRESKKDVILREILHSQTQRKVKSVIEDGLDENLPESYDRKTYNSKCDAVFNLVLDYSEQHKKWAL